MNYNNDNQDNKVNNKSVCLICNNNYQIISDPETSEIICVNCGKVLSDPKEEKCNLSGIYKDINNINITSTESTNNTKLLSSTNNTVLYNLESPTVIGRNNVDTTGRKIGTDMENILHRLRIWERRTGYNDPTYRNLNYDFEELEKLKYKLGISDSIVKKAFYFYKKAQSLGSVRGRTINGIINASLYLACKEFENPKTIKEISKITNVKEKTI